jgi:hypothetical protein
MQRFLMGSTLSEITEMRHINMRVKEGTGIHEKDGFELHEAEQYGSHLPELREPRSAVELSGDNIFQRAQDKTVK